jgi:hypothetical protein
MLCSQIALFRQKAFDLQAQHRESSIPLRSLLGFNMRVRQLLSIELSNMCVINENNRHFSADLEWISALVSSKRIGTNLEIFRHRSKECNTLTEDRKINTAPLAIEGLCQAFEQEK